MNWSKLSSNKRGYGAKWQGLRELALQRDKGLCQPCKRAGRVTTAREVDHIIGKAEGARRGIPEHEIESLINLQSICSECHAAKTTKESGGTSRPTIGLDGWPI